MTSLKVVREIPTRRYFQTKDKLWRIFNTFTIVAWILEQACTLQKHGGISGLSRKPKSWRGEAERTL